MTPPNHHQAEPIRLGGIGKWLSATIENKTGIDSRYVILGHVLRGKSALMHVLVRASQLSAGICCGEGGVPCATDRILATHLGHHAMTLLRAGKQNRLVVLRGT